MSISVLAASTSTVYGSNYLEYLKDEIEAHFSGVDCITFIPFARASGLTWDEYTNQAKPFFEKLGKEVIGIHEEDNVLGNLDKAQALFTGGGNTFLLLNTLYTFGVMDLLRESILTGIPYLGTSAGSNILGQSIKTTNDMPIIYPPSFDALRILPFNINPHYLDPIEGSTHMGETRETRISEYLIHNSTSVVGLREGSYLTMDDAGISLKGNLAARVFEKGKAPWEANPGHDFTLFS